MGQDVIHVMLVDDDEQIQQALRTAIETHPELKLLGQAYTLKEAMLLLPNPTARCAKSKMRSALTKKISEFCGSTSTLTAT